MRKEFISKVLALGSVDTKKYRYRVVPFSDQANHPGARTVVRLPIDWLDTTAALNSWEPVANVYPNPIGTLIELVR